MAYELEHHQVATNGLHVHVVQCGPPIGPLVILLHGFPEFWFGWRGQIQALAAAGYRVWVPDQRGYNLSDKPRPVASYTIDQLGADVLGLLTAAGRPSARIVGHDWGAAVVWWLAMHHPDKIERAAVLNVPHPAVLSRTLRRSPKQLLKSWYIFFFQLPWLPEKLLRRKNWLLARRTLQETSRRGTFSAVDLQQYEQAWSQPGAMTGMINWYRAAARYARRLARPGRVTVPVHIIWGRRDAFLTAGMARQSLAYCNDGQLTYFDKATHWVQHEEAEAVNELLLRFLKPA
ncbi:alpha/beta hydrolase [Hymenobacter sp. BT175]|uniref:alpha/beta fold hydrolase n=1 Tax=Hymenobacter translucens TaxID=2886507 RepID=UPI001D0E6204|nr:alpha/beta hydrolase [Hymenobacter translucens]MCC2547775.1 alpha/beta hydrolase [Hymenobacter translucens]